MDDYKTYTRSVFLHWIENMIQKAGGETWINGLTQLKENNRSPHPLFSLLFITVNFFTDSVEIHIVPLIVHAQVRHHLTDKIHTS